MGINGVMGVEQMCHKALQHSIYQNMGRPVAESMTHVA